MKAGPHEVATHVGRDHALHGFAEPFGLRLTATAGEKAAAVGLQRLDTVGILLWLMMVI